MYDYVSCFRLSYSLSYGNWWNLNRSFLSPKQESKRLVERIKT